MKSSLTFPRLLSGSQDGLIRILHLRNQKVLSEVLPTGKEGHHHAPVSTMIMDYRVCRLYTGDKSGCIVIWNSRKCAQVGFTYSILRRLYFADFHGKTITHLSYNYQNRGNLLISGSPGGIVRKFNLYTQELDLLPLSITSKIEAGNKHSPTRSIYSPDGKYVVICDQGLHCFENGSYSWIASVMNESQFNLGAFEWCKSAHVLSVANPASNYVVIFYPSQFDRNCLNFESE